MTASTHAMKRPSRLRIRRSTSAGTVLPLPAYSAAWTSRKTARPHANDITMNSGGSSALPYACRATRNAKIAPVPVVSTIRQTNAASPARAEWTFIRRSISVHR